MKIILVDERISPLCERSLLKLGFYVIKMPPDRDLGPAVASHPDTLAFFCDGELITTADYCDTAAYIFSELRELCSSLKISFTSDKRGGRYPEDCKMNALVIDKRIFCKSDSISDAILDFAKRRGYEVIHTNQGYPACTVLAFGNSAITADRGIAGVLENSGVKVTLIDAGHISLPPHEYGFIGGASFVFGNRVFFFGDITTHPDGEKILRVISESGFTPVSLSDEELSDLGGAIVI
ncbi:MAG: hypothetical protein IJX97_02160 [Clostridia bacterium]|nr:hypothetical protein [Clostridia bacterium]